MSREMQVRKCLKTIEEILQNTGLWQTCAPNAAAFESTEPFCVDTMMPLQWLQWLFLPRMHALLGAGSELPGKLAIAPYYEVALEGDIPGRATLLHALNQLDKLFESHA
ncbi:YqcC family protein [Erwinia psidii]|uniref:YqcC family protein n=1 Tax=Erwinia psidii TaxID=69224 RepID=A0A3N6S3I5_9GAMM|nr:YqcC family protein [Erwinia psidii]MCX8956855.1 YqcC family protein [Erwinia psidii]MCX8960334.1 YqcC family protein [Erwinia psidii]MCX8964486.1 YqcC family protein [Erwinia psidii]RQM40174.1 YqcC family protein [Erwinia psidii]